MFASMCKTLSQGRVSLCCSVACVYLNIDSLCLHRRADQSHPRPAAVKHGIGRKTQWGLVGHVQKAAPVEPEEWVCDKVNKTPYSSKVKLEWLCSFLKPTYSFLKPTCHQRQEIWWIWEAPCPGSTNKLCFMQGGAKGCHSAGRPEAYVIVMARMLDREYGWLCD